MKTIKMLAVVGVVFISTMSYGGDRDTNYFSKHGNYQGFSRDNGDSVDFYDRHNNPSGSYDRDSGVMLDRHNNFQGFTDESDDDD